MKRKRPFTQKKVMVSFETTLDQCEKRVKTLPDEIATRGEKKKLEKEVRFLRESLSEIKKRNDQWIKMHEEFQRHLLEELKKERINVRPTQAKPLQTVAWSMGRQKKETKPSSAKGKRRRNTKKK